MENMPKGLFSSGRSLGKPSPPVLFGLLSLMIIAFYGFTGWRATPDVEFDPMQRVGFERIPHGYYNLLTRSLERGELDLGIPANRELLSLKDPYSPQNRMLGSFAWDASFYGGRYYLYFGITPVLVLFLPFHLLTGLYFPGWLAAVIFCSLGYLFSILCLSSLWTIWQRNDGEASRIRSPGPLDSRGTAILSALILGMGSLAPLILRSPLIYEIAQSGGYCFGMFGCHALLKSLVRERSKISRHWAVASGLGFALAVGCRPGLLIAGCMALLFLGLKAYFRQGRFDQLPAFFLPFAGYGMLLAWYNQLRFGDWKEFGWHYVLNDYYLRHPGFSMQDLWVNLRDYLILPPAIQPLFPYIQLRWDWMIPAGWHAAPEAPCIGILWVFPAAILGFAALSRRLKLDGETRSLLTGCLGIYLFLLLLDSLVAHTARYQMDMAPYLLIPACFLGLLLRQQTTGLQRRILAVALWGSALWCTLFVSLSSFTEVHGSAAEEVRHFRRIATAMPGDERAAFQLAHALEKRGFTKDAVKAYRHALDLDPSDSRTHLNLANLLAQGSAPKEALTEYMRTLELDPNSAEAEYDLGNLLMKHGNTPGALLCYRAAVAIQPGLASAHDNLGNLLLQQGNVGEAIAEYRRALELDPSNAEAHNNLGKALLLRGLLNESLEQIREAVRLQPSSRLFQENLSKLLEASRIPRKTDGKAGRSQTGRD